VARFVKYMSNRRGGFIEPTEETINGLNSLINWCENEVPSQLNFYMNELAFYMALVNQGEARSMSFGPGDPSQTHPEEAWRLPVRRITNRYYLGWKIKQLRPGIVQLYNDSREAYFIEFGINWLGEGRRVRRPVRKLSLIRTMNFMLQTNAYSRVWSEVFKHKGKGYGFTQVVQSPGGHLRTIVRGPSMGSFAGPKLGRRLPG
jgi:hypothetical protein